MTVGGGSKMLNDLGRQSLAVDVLAQNSKQNFF